MLTLAYFTLGNWHEISTSILAQEFGQLPFCFSSDVTRAVHAYVASANILLLVLEFMLVLLLQV